MQTASINSNRKLWPNNSCWLLSVVKMKAIMKVQWLRKFHKQLLNIAWKFHTDSWLYRMIGLLLEIYSMIILSNIQIYFYFKDHRIFLFISCLPFKFQLLTVLSVWSWIKTLNLGTNCQEWIRMHCHINTYLKISFSQ